MGGNFSLRLFNCLSYESRRQNLDIIHPCHENRDYLHIPDMVGTIELLKNTNCPKFNFCVQSQEQECMRISFMMGTYYVVLDLLGSYFHMFIIYHNPVISCVNYIMKIDGKMSFLPYSLLGAF